MRRNSSCGPRKTLRALRVGDADAGTRKLDSRIRPAMLRTMSATLMRGRHRFRVDTTVSASTWSIHLPATPPRTLVLRSGRTLLRHLRAAGLRGLFPLIRYASNPAEHIDDSGEMHPGAELPRSVKSPPMRRRQASLRRAALKQRCKNRFWR